MRPAALAAQPPRIHPGYFSAARSAFNPAPRGFRFAGWELRLRTRHLVAASGQEVRLSKTEFALLLALLEHPKQILSREQLMDLTQADADIYDRAIDVQVMRLRRKLEAQRGAPDLLRTRRGLGYFLDAEVQPLA